MPNSSIPEPPLRRIYVLMRLAREWELRFENLFRTGTVKKWYSAVGHEALSVTAALVLEKGDALATIHREAGAILAHYLDLGRLLPDLFPSPLSGDDRDERDDPGEYLHVLAAQMMGKAAGFTRGYDRSYHFSHVDRPRGILHLGMVSHLGAMIPVAAGVALGLRREGTDRVALNFIGDGGSSTGDFHEALNMAAVMRLPFILVIENDHYAFSTPEQEQFACRSLADRAAGYGIPGERIDGGDPLAVWDAMGRAVKRARRGEGPTLIEALLPRLRGHSEGDDSMSMIPPRDLERYRREDPLERFETTLVDRRVMTREEIQTIRTRLRDLLIDVTDRTQKGDDPVPGSRPVFATCPGTLPETTGAERSGITRKGTTRQQDTNYLEAISRALREEMRRDPSVFLMGQDIGAYGGAFKVTRGFLAEFGAERVINTPMAESGAIGLACGAAFLGQRPVVEMQFADFISCGFNQVVNVAAKIYYRWGRPVPLVIRCPTGGGFGGGPFHSQNPEAWFLHVPGLKVVAPAFPRDALGLLKAAIRDPNPVLFFEHKQLYRRVSEPLLDGEIFVPLGSARVVREGSDITLITYGWMVHRSLAAAEQVAASGISVEVIDLRSLSPLDEQTLIASAEKTGKVMVVHEAPLTGGFGGEIAARIGEKAFDRLDGPVRRLAYPDTPVPFHKNLEEDALPGEQKIVDLIRELATY